MFRFSLFYNFTKQIAKPIMKNYSAEILKILVYSDIFKYPLTSTEIYERSKLSIIEVEKGLEVLVKSKKVFLIEDFYSLHNSNEIIESRKNRNQLAQKSFSTARFITKIISIFPFIRGVFLSGSISKFCMEKNSDIDFFIITAPNRLWIARTFCIFFKKFFLFNSEKYFCFNYIIDSNHLKINDLSVFTANEISSLIPVFGEAICRRFFEENNWVNDFFPNYPIGKKPIKIVKKSWIQESLESIFNNKLSDKLDNWLFIKTLEINQKRHPAKFFQNPDFFINFQRFVAKAHTTNGHQKILEKYRNSLHSYQETTFAL